MNWAMEEALRPPLQPPREKIVEVCGVLSVRANALGDGMQMLHCHTLLPGLADYDVKLQPDEVGVLRFDSPDPDEAERVQVINGSLQDFSDDYFTDTTRRRLQILNPRRAVLHEAYLAGEEAKLRRIMSQTPGLVQPRRRVPGLHLHPRLAPVTERLARHQTKIDRQLGVMWRIANLAAADALTGVNEPETARARALNLLDLTDDAG